MRPIHINFHHKIRKNRKKRVLRLKIIRKGARSQWTFRWVFHWSIVYFNSRLTGCPDFQYLKFSIFRIYHSGSIYSSPRLKFFFSSINKKSIMDPDDEICKKGCRMYCRDRWNFGRPKFCDVKRITEALDGLHQVELFNMAVKLMWEKSSYVREGQYDYVLAVQRGIITDKLEGKLCVLEFENFI